MQRRRKRGALAWAFLSLGGVCAFMTACQEGKRPEEAAAYQEGEVHGPPISRESQEVLKYNGTSYRRNTAVRPILCIGVDTRGELKGESRPGSGGQADGVFLVAQDMARDRVKILMIPRDTMTPIRLYDLSGNELGKEEQHLTLAYAYGDGGEKSCELLREAVSELLCGLKIDGYVAVNLSAIQRLNDEAGGVEVNVEEEGLSQRDPRLEKGKRVRLMGEQAELYVRYRDISKANSALERMERQKSYMESYLRTVKEGAEEDSGLVPRLMEELEKRMVTDLSKDQYLDMCLSVLKSSQEVEGEDFIRLPGEGVETELFDEYRPDREGIKEVVIGLFYKELR